MTSDFRLGILFQLLRIAFLLCLGILCVVFYLLKFLALFRHHVCIRVALETALEALAMRIQSHWILTCSVSASVVLHLLFKEKRGQLLISVLSRLTKNVGLLLSVKFVTEWIILWRHLAVFFSEVDHILVVQNNLLGYLGRELCWQLAGITSRHVDRPLFLHPKYPKLN